MKTAKELRNLQVITNKNFGPSRLQQVVEKAIESAANNGMYQADMEILMDLYSKEDLMVVKRSLVNKGYAVMMGQISGFLASNLIVPAKYSLKVLW